MAILPYKGVMPTIEENVFIAPGAMVIGNVTIREGASVWYNTVIRADTAPIVIGRRTNIQDNCTLHVDDDAPLTIGDAVQLGMVLLFMVRPWRPGTGWNKSCRALTCAYRLKNNNRSMRSGWRA